MYCPQREGFQLVVSRCVLDMTDSTAMVIVQGGTGLIIHNKAIWDNPKDDQSLKTSLVLNNPSAMLELGTRPSSTTYLVVYPSASLLQP